MMKSSVCSVTLLQNVYCLMAKMSLNLKQFAPVFMKFRGLTVSSWKNFGTSKYRADWMVLLGWVAVTCVPNCAEFASLTILYHIRQFLFSRMYLVWSRYCYSVASVIVCRRRRLWHYVLRPYTRTLHAHVTLGKVGKQTFIRSVIGTSQCVKC